MYQFENRIFIDRPPLEVFNFVTNLDNLSKWQGERETFQWLTEDPPGVGSRYKVEAKLLGRKIEGEMEVTSWEVPDQYTIRGSNGPVTSVYKRIFEAQGEGTLLTQVSQVEVNGIFSVLEGVVGRYAKRTFASLYPNLKQIMEADQKTNTVR